MSPLALHLTYSSHLHLQHSSGMLRGQIQVSPLHVKQLINWVYKVQHITIKNSGFQLLKKEGTKMFGNMSPVRCGKD